MMRRSDSRRASRQPPLKSTRRTRRVGACLPAQVRLARRRRRGQEECGPWLAIAVAAAVLGEALARSVFGFAIGLASPPRRANARSAGSVDNGAATVQTPHPGAVGTIAADTGLARFETARPVYLPPLTVGDVALARAVDYLLRNEGGRYGRATEARWQTVDAASLSLGVYLRDVDHRSGWRSLQREIASFQLQGARPVLREDRDLDREKLSKLVQLSRVWAGRGTNILLGSGDGGIDDAPAPELVPRDDLDPPGSFRP